MTFFKILKLLYFAVYVVVANKTACNNNPCIDYNENCSEIKDSKGTITGILLDRRNAQNSVTVRMRDISNCTNAYSRWTVLVKNFPEVMVIGKFEPYLGRVLLYAINFTKFQVQGDAFNGVELDLLLSPTNENSTIEFFEHAFTGVIGHIIYTKSFPVKTIMIKNFQIWSSLTFLSLHNHTVEKFGLHYVPIPQRKFAPYDFCASLFQFSKETESERYLNHILVWATLVIASFVLICCIAVIIIMITNKRDSGKFTPPKKGQSSDAIPLIESTKLKTPSANGIKSPALPARNPYPTTERALPKPPVSDKRVH